MTLRAEEHERKQLTYSESEHDLVKESSDASLVESPLDDPFIVSYSRWIAILLWSGLTVLYIQRINISVVVVIMSDDYGWSSSEIGIILASFYVGYVMTQVPGGVFANKRGGGSVFVFGVIASSVFTLLSGVFGDNIYGLAVVRFAMGFGEGVTFPAMYAMFSMWISKKRRSGVVAFCYSGVIAGTVIAMATSAPLAQLWNWRLVFFAAAAAGALWIPCWVCFGSSFPETNRYVKHSVAAQGIANRRSIAGAGIIPYRVLLKSSAVWSIIICNYCTNFGFYVLVSWCPKYFVQRYGFSIETAGFLALFPYIGLFIMGISCGRVADVFVRRGTDLLKIRRIFQTVGFVVPGLLLTALTFVEDSYTGVAIVIAAVTFTGFSNAGNAVNHLDIAPKYASVLLGFSNTAGTVPGIIGVAGAGIFLDAFGSWNPIFYITAGTYLVGTIVFLTMAKAHEIFH
eukprot:ANDGO_07010.mRNA.1 Sodium-dependent phosphate transport protein 1